MQADSWNKTGKDMLFGKWALLLGQNCKAYLTKSGLMVFGFCPAGSTSKVDLTSR